VDWANGKNVIKNATLFQWYQRLIRLRDTFDKITFEHIYRDNNLAADSLSKAGITMAEGILWYKDASNMEPDGWITLNIYNSG